MDMTVWELIRIGGVAMYIILASSALAVGLTLERLYAVWAFSERARELSSTVTRCLSRGATAEARTACERSASPLAEVYLAGFERLGRTSRDALEGAIDRERQRVVLRMKSNMWMLGTIGAVTPFVGLGGTVVGIMGAFSNISASGNVSITVVGKPIAEALVATAGGIAVAVVAVVLYNFLNQHMARLAAELRLSTDEFIEALRERPDDAEAAKAKA